mgnify:CR=1 FL=1
MKNNFSLKEKYLIEDDHVDDENGGDCDADYNVCDDCDDDGLSLIHI